MNKDIPVVFRNLLDKCVRGMHEGATVLHSRIKDDMGKGLPLSASALAQEAQRIIDHVEKIRYTKELFNVPPVTEGLVGICKRYNILQKRFQTEVVARLADIAAPEEGRAEARSGFIERLRQGLERFVPGEVVEQAERIDMGMGSITAIAPDLLTALAQIIDEARAILEDIDKLG